MLSPTPNYSTDPAELSFRRCLHLIYEPWLQQFLFPTHTTYFEQLQQTLFQPRRIAATMSLTTLSPTDQLSLNEQISFLLLPSFSTGPVSVSYQITHYASTKLSTCKAPYIARCVRDDINGVLLSIAELPHTGLTELTLCMQRSPGYREHIFLVLDTERFRDVVKGKMHDYDDGNMKSALIYSFQSSEIRDCPTCAQRSMDCKCPLRLVRKKHPMDFDADMVNLASYMGSYDGLSWQAVYERGVKMYNSVCSTRSAVEFSYDCDQRRMLEAWALQDTFTGRSINLMKLVMPDAETLPLLDEGCVVDEVGVDTVASGKGDVLTWSPFSDDVDVGDVPIEAFLSDGFAPCAVEEELPDFGPNLDSVLATQDEPSDTTLSVSSEDSHGQAHSNASLHGQKSVCNGDNCRQSTQEAAEDTQNPSLEGASPKPIQQMNQPNNSASITTAVNNDAITRPRRMGRPPAPKIRGITKLVQIAPAAKGTTAAGVQKVTNSFSEEVRQKIELRKVRNRASACRSNERKKKQVQALKDNLENAKKQEALLRKTETSLREENLELRAKLSDWRSVS